MGHYPTFLAIALFAASPIQQDGKYQALYLMQNDQVTESLQRYRDFASQKGHDFGTLQEMCLTMLKRGAASPDPHTFLMTLYGAGLSNSLHALDMLEKGLVAPDPNIQLLSLHFIARHEDDRALSLLNEAMSSDFLSTRMEAAFYLSLKKHPRATGQIEGLMFRLPPAFKPYFPSFFALIGTSDATATLRRLLEDPDIQVRVESILQVARMGRDDFLPLLRKRLSHNQAAELEASLFALGALKDGHSHLKLKKLLSHSAETTRLAAARALNELGDRSGLPIVLDLAHKHNPFAIQLLADFSETQDELAQLVESGDLQVRINAATALLRHRDPRAKGALLEILISDERDLAFYPMGSVGRSLSAWKALPSAELRAKDPTIDLSFSLAIREHLFREALHLPEADFCEIAEKVLFRPQNDLIPLAVASLESLQTPRAIALLEKGATHQSSPFVRDYCRLGLYRLGCEGPYEEQITQWVMRQKGAPLIQFRPLLPWKFRLEQSDYALSPTETSRLLIDSFLAIAQKRDQKSISFLLEAIQHGNPHNRFALMGLLMQATE
jgi:HEAT repeat protein